MKEKEDVESSGKEETDEEEEEEVKPRPVVPKLGSEEVGNDPWVGCSS